MSFIDVIDMMSKNNRQNSVWSCNHVNFWLFAFLGWKIYFKKLEPSLIFDFNNENKNSIAVEITAALGVNASPIMYSCQPLII